MSFADKIRNVLSAGRGDEPVKLPDRLGPMIGDLVSHEGSFGAAGDENGPYRVVGFRDKAVMDGQIPKVVRLCRFANRRFTVTCLADELEWLNADNAWVLPGRLLNAAQKEAWKVMLGTKYPPPADKHIAARAFLRSEGVLK